MMGNSHISFLVAITNKPKSCIGVYLLIKVEYKKLSVKITIYNMY